MLCDSTAPTSANVTKRELAARYRKHEKHNRAVQREIKHLQATPDVIIPTTSFSRVVREILNEQGDFCIRADAVKALQHAAEDCMTDMFSQANSLALYNGRETVTERDVQFTQPNSPATEEHCEHPLIAPDQSCSEWPS